EERRCGKNLFDRVVSAEGCADVRADVEAGPVVDRGGVDRRLGDGAAQVGGGSGNDASAENCRGEKEPFISKCPAFETIQLRYL
ncbi:hypothetical protein ACS2TD_27295, partial [Bacillus cereus group sp. BC334]|uniref:hypothetical protein n=1 Tax=Bacillus cereus group sp. BC334 TaxID=3445305 RepID=UPI003F1FB283